MLPLLRKTHCRRARRWDCSADSTPSAVTSRPSPRASRTMPDTMAWSRVSSINWATNRRSILSPSSGASRRNVSEACPTPKSSTTRRRPNALSARSVSMVVSPSIMVLFSVSSNVRASGGHPVSARICATRRSKPCSRSCTAERFTATRNVASAGCEARHCTRARQACCSTCSPMGTMSPVSSASPRKPGGDSSPRSGSRQRSKASAAITRSATTSRMGW